MKDKFVPVATPDDKTPVEERRAKALIRVRQAFASERLYEPPPDATNEEKYAYALERVRAALQAPPEPPSLPDNATHEEKRAHALERVRLAFAQPKDDGNRENDRQRDFDPI